MRNLFLALLFANLILFGWQQWVRPGGNGLSNASGDPVPRLQVFAEQVDSPGTATASQDSATCRRIGPFPDDAAMQRAREELAERGIGASAVELPGRVWIGRWVLVGAFAGRDEAEVARQKLIAAGVPDAAAMDDGGRMIVSLGVFQDPEGVKRVIAAARRVGMRAVTRDRFRNAIQPWLVIDGGSVLPPLDELLGDARILRSETAKCLPEADQGT